MKVGLSSPPFERAGSTREQGLHAKDAEQGRAEKRRWPEKGTSTKPK